jgi:hypothetical protein
MSRAAARAGLTVWYELLTKIGYTDF